VAFSSFEELSGRVYERFSTLLETLGLVYGSERLVRALGVYVERYRFKHPEPIDFVEVIRTELGEEAATALRTSMFADGWVDYAVKTITTQPNEPTLGRSDDGNTTPRLAPFRNQLLLERRGTLSFPITLEVVLQNGQVLRRPLDPIPTRHWLRWDTTSPIVAAALDPDERITIDDDLTNQTQRVDRAPPPLRLSALLHAAGSILLSLVWP
jgi:aminopeptidase N